MTTITEPQQATYIYPTKPEDVVDGATYIAHTEPVAHLTLVRRGGHYSWGGDAPGAVSIDFPARKVMRRDAEGLYSEVQVMRAEWQLLDALYAREGEMVGRDELVRILGLVRYERDVYQYLRVCVGRLRAKIGEGTNGPIVTLKGVGYRLEKGDVDG